MRPTSVLATVTGRDRPGVTAAFFAALAAHDVDVRDVEQVVIQDRLTLTVLFDLRGDTASLRNSVTLAAGALGMVCEIVVAENGDPVRPRPPGDRIHVIMLGRPLRPGAVGHVAQSIADAGGNIETVTQLSTDLSTEPSSALEMVVRAPHPAGLRAVLVQAASDTGVDIAVEAAGLRRRAKRLVVLDLDTTLIRSDVIDIVAEHVGLAEQARAITDRVSAGEIDFADALRARVALLAGLPHTVLDDVRDRLELRTGAHIVITTLRRLGYHVGVVSAGITAVLSRLVTDLDLDFVAANDLEVVDGLLTGAVLGPILDPRGKADALVRFAGKFAVSMSQTVAVGNGADDIELLENAGLGIAFNAKAALRTSEDSSGDNTYLDSVLFVLGISADDVAEAASR